jgi:Flp pilus assembly protein TadD
MLHTLALAQAANGNYKEATVTAQQSMSLARKDGDNGYVKLNETKINEWAGK